MAIAPIAAPHAPIVRVAPIADRAIAPIASIAGKLSSQPVATAIIAIGIAIASLAAIVAIVSIPGIARIVNGARIADASAIATTTKPTESHNPLAPPAALGQLRW